MGIDWSKAPEGATHFDPTDEHTDSCWMMMIARKAWCYFNGGEWESVDYDDIAHDIAEYIPHPTKPSAPEWDGKTWPIPVGATVEVQVEPMTPFYVVEVIAHYEGSVVFIAGDDYPHGQYDGCSHPECFRPLRTKEQRERDELRRELMKTIDQSPINPHGFASMVNIDNAADAIMERYELKEREK